MMFGRIFGRGKDDQDQAVCADCGRTLLAGEWTQTVVDERGEERLICSLCGQAYGGERGDAVTSAPAPANNGRVRETRSESRLDDSPTPVVTPPARDSHADSDAFWQALKDKDAQIERLKAELARAEAERQELAGRFARVGAVADGPKTEPPSALTGDSSEPGERTWGETPAEFATEMAALREAEAAAEAPPAVEAADEASPEAEQPAVVPAADRMADERPEGDEVVVAEAEAPTAAEAEVAADAETEADSETPTAAGDDVITPATVFEDTQPIQTISEEMLAGAEDDDASTGEIAATEAAAAVVAGGGSLPGEPVEAAAPAAETEAHAAQSAADVEAAAASLTLLQRGVDLLNVSRVPQKIAETNEQLGLPHVHVGFDGQVVAVTFMWTMGWYRFHVDDSGGVVMSDRGYEELADHQPNAGVRADGTVQLAPAQISRAAAQRAQTAPEPSEPLGRPAEPAPSEPTAAPEPPSVAAQKPPEILSKSLLGQRSDDETASWEKTTARDFDWDR
jgi:hypothetical protein